MKLSQICETFRQHSNAQFGDCGPAVFLAAKDALERGIRDFIVVEGMVLLNTGEVMPHTWIEQDGTVHDPTVSQFENNIQQYGPPGEYRDTYSPEEFLESFEDQYGYAP